MFTETVEGRRMTNALSASIKTRQVYLLLSKGIEDLFSLLAISLIVREDMEQLDVLCCARRVLFAEQHLQRLQNCGSN